MGSENKVDQNKTIEIDQIEDEESWDAWSGNPQFQARTYHIPFSLIVALESFRFPPPYKQKQYWRILIKFPKSSSNVKIKDEILALPMHPFGIPFILTDAKGMKKVEEQLKELGVEINFGERLIILDRLDDKT